MSTASTGSPLTKQELAALVARDIAPGSFVNLGIGQPTAVADHLPADAGIVLHTENGMLNMGPKPVAGQEDPELVNAGKQPVTELPGSSYFDSAQSFAMMRGGHLDVCVLGAFQVSVAGDLANWHTGSADAIPAVGGAMDLAIGARQVFVMMDLFTRSGEPKLVQECSYPLTGMACVTRIYTPNGIFVPDASIGVVMLRQAWGMSKDELEHRLGLTLKAEPLAGAASAADVLPAPGDG